jgi:hypothetical protein
MNIKKWLHSDTSKYIISIILGLGLSTLFRKECQGEDCIIFTSPPINELEKETYLYGDKCFTYKNKSEVCDSQKKIVRFA